MPGKPWPDTALGPRHTRRNPSGYEELSDPAGGEKVPRCGACGMPNPSDIVGKWRHLSKARFPVCGQCMMRHNTPDPDPLTVEAGAA